VPPYKKTRKMGHPHTIPVIGAGSTGVVYCESAMTRDLPRGHFEDAARGGVT